MTTLNFTDGDVNPEIKPGTMMDCIVVTENEKGGKYAYAAYYLSAYLLDREDCTCSEGEHDDGCPTTGWFYDNSNWEYDNCYFAISGKVLCWAPIPSAADILAARSPQGSDGQ